MKSLEHTYNKRLIGIDFQYKTNKQITSNVLAHFYANNNFIIIKM